MNIIAVPESTYLEFKQDVINNKFITRTLVESDSITLKDFSTIILKGQQIPITRFALQALLDLLGVSQAFIKTVQAAFNQENSEKILNQILSAIRNGNKCSLILVFNEPLKSIVNVYRDKKKTISDFQYFDILERLIAKTPSAFLRNISRGLEGDISSIIKVPALEFQFGNFDNEYFTSGFTLDLAAYGLSSSFFTERLVCTNGMVTKNKYSTISVDIPDNVSNFITDIMDPLYQINNVQEFKARMNRTRHTQASLREVLRARTAVVAVTGAYCDRFLPDLSADRIEATFNNYSPDYLINREIQEFLYTDISLWDLVNEITATSAKIEQSNLPIGERVNLKLQMLGGDMLFSKPDLTPNNIRQIFEPNKFYVHKPTTNLID